MTSQPAPSRFTMNEADRRSGYAKKSSNFALDHLTFKASDLLDFCGREFVIPVSNAASRRPMVNSVCHVPGVGFPRKMPLRDTRQMAITATVRCLMFRRRGRTMRAFTNKTGHDVHLSVDPKHPDAAGIPSIGPYQALDATVSKDCFMEEFHGLSPRGIAAQRVTVAQQSGMVGGAQAPRLGWLAAIGDRAYKWVSHFDTSSVLAWSERAAVVTHPARSLFVQAFHPRFNGVCRAN